MKQIFLLLFCFGFVAVLGVQAQSCIKSTAAKAAAMDENIIKKVNNTTGEVAYVQKKVCPATGEVTYTDMEYCSKSHRFVAVSNGYKTSCSKNAAIRSKSYGQKALMVSNVPLHCTAAQKAACLQANQKTQTARAAFASLDNQLVKP